MLEGTVHYPDTNTLFSTPIRSCPVTTYPENADEKQIGRIAKRKYDLGRHTMSRVDKESETVKQDVTVTGSEMGRFVVDTRHATVTWWDALQADWGSPIELDEDVNDYLTELRSSFDSRMSGGGSIRVEEGEESTGAQSIVLDVGDEESADTQVRRERAKGLSSERDTVSSRQDDTDRSKSSDPSSRISIPYDPSKASTKISTSNNRLANIASNQDDWKSVISRARPPPTSTSMDQSLDESTELQGLGEPRGVWS